ELVLHDIAVEVEVDDPRQIALRGGVLGEVDARHLRLRSAPGIGAAGRAGVRVAGFDGDLLIVELHARAAAGQEGGDGDGPERLLCDTHCFHDFSLSKYGPFDPTTSSPVWAPDR